MLIACDWFLKVVHGQALALRELGHDVALLCRAHPDEYGGDEGEWMKVLDELVDAGIPIGVLNGRRLGPGAGRQVATARRWMARWRPTVVHAHENFDPRLLLATRGYRTVLTVHDPVAHPGDVPRRPFERWTRARWRSAADRIVVHGEALRDEIHEREIGAVDVVPHGIGIAEQAFPPPAHRTVLLFGRLEPYKGVEILVDAMRIVWRSRPEVRLAVFGRGPAAASLPRDEPRIELEERYIGEEELDGVFAAATVVALPYTQASQSGVGLQALARGVPLVVTDVGALPELAMHADWIVAAGDRDALADALLRRLDDTHQHRTAVHRFAAQRFSWRAVAERYAEVYERALVTEARQ